MADKHPIIAALIAQFEARRKILEDQVKLAESVFHTVKDIKTMEELEQLSETTEKRITYTQARLEEIDHTLIEILSGEATDNMMSAAEALFKKQEAPSTKPKAPKPDIEVPRSADPAFVVRDDGGSFLLTDTVRKYIDGMEVGATVKPWDVGKQLQDAGVLRNEEQIRTVRTTFSAQTNTLKRVERGVYERI